MVIARKAFRFLSWFAGLGCITFCAGSVLAEIPSWSAWQVLWHREIDGAVRAGPSSDPEREQLFVGTGQGVYYALNLNTGNLEWEHEFATTTRSKGVATGGVFVFGRRGGQDDSTLQGIDQTDGTLRWERRSFQSIDSAVYLYRDAAVVIGSTQVVVVDAKTGTSNRFFTESFDDNVSFRNGCVFDVTLYHEVVQTGPPSSALRAWDLTTDELLWEHRLDHIGTHEIVASKDYLAWTGVRLTPRKRVVVVADRRTGEVLHERSAEQHVHGLSLSEHGLLVVEGLSVSLWSHDLQTRIWEFETRFGAYTTPLVVGNTVLIGGYDEEGLMALDLGDGSLKARYPLELREVGGYWVSPERDLLVFGEADDNPAPGPRNVYALRVDPEFWD